MLTQKQLEQHNKYITGSKVASILNLPNAYKSKYQLFCEMHGDVEIGESDNIYLRMGQYMELAIHEYCIKELGWKIKELSADESFKFHPQYNFIGSLIDRIRLDTSAVVEFKNVDISKFKEWHRDDGNNVVPDHLLTQIYLYMSIYDLPGYVVAFIGGNRPVVVDVPRNPKVENFILSECVTFWDDLQNHRYPEIDGSKACTETLKKLYPDNNDVLVDGNGLLGQKKIMKHVQKYQEASLLVKEWETEKNLHGNSLKNIINDNQGIIWSDGSKVTYKKCKDGKKFNEAKFKDENLELYNKYLETKKGYRTLRVNLKKGGLLNEQQAA